MFSHYTSEEEMLENTLFYNELLEFVKSISGKNMWWFKECYKQLDNRYAVIFSSYATPEYRNFLLSISVNKENGKYQFKVVKQVTDLA